MLLVLFAGSAIFRPLIVSQHFCARVSQIQPQPTLGKPSWLGEYVSGRHKASRGDERGDTALLPRFANRYEARRKIEDATKQPTALESQDNPSLGGVQPCTSSP